MASARRFRYRDYYYEPEISNDDAISGAHYAKKDIDMLRKYYPSLDTDTFNKRVENHAFKDIGGGASEGVQIGEAVPLLMEVAGVTEMGGMVGAEVGPVGAALGAGVGSIAGAIYYALNTPTASKVSRVGDNLMIDGVNYPKGYVFGIKGNPKDGRTTYYKFLGFDDGQSDQFKWVPIGKKGAQPEEMRVGSMQILLDGKGVVVIKLHHGHLPKDMTSEAEEEYEDMLQAQYRRNQGRAQYRNEGRTMRRRDSRNMQRMSRLYN